MTTAVIGERVTLSCRTTLITPVNWHYQPSENATSDLFLSSAGNIFNDYKKYFAVDRSVPGDFSLVILNVTHDDAGVYICQEDFGKGLEHRITLTVHGKISILLNYNYNHTYSQFSPIHA